MSRCLAILTTADNHKCILHNFDFFEHGLPRKRIGFPLVTNDPYEIAKTVEKPKIASRFYELNYYDGKTAFYTEVKQ